MSNIDSPVKEKTVCVPTTSPITPVREEGRFKECPPAPRKQRLIPRNEDQN